MLAPATADRWHVLLAQPQQERRAAERLQRERLKVYVPLELRRRRAGRKMRDRLDPLLPGYLFLVATGGIPWHLISVTPGIRRDCDGNPALMRNGAYATVPNWAIEIVRAKESKLRGGIERAPGSLRIGQTIEAIEGPFRWLQGRIDNLARLDTHARVGVAMAIFGRLVSVEFEVSQVQAV